MNEQIIAAVITYFPKKEMVENILSFHPFFFKILIIDNTDKEDMGANFFFDEIILLPNVDIIKNNKNVGIAKGLNLAAEYALAKGCLWMMTMDQDSIFEENQILKYLTCFNNIKHKNVGAIGPSLILDGEEQPNSLDITDKPGAAGCSYKKVVALITSGSIINLEAYKIINGFDEDLFIDGVDDDYCIRLQLQGYDILQLSDVFLRHSIGKSIFVRTFYIGKRTHRNLHPPVRLYYFTRNHLLLIKRYKKHFPEKAAKYKHDLIVRIKNNLLYGKQKFKAVRLLALGIFHYWTDKFGKRI